MHRWQGRVGRGAVTGGLALLAGMGGCAYDEGLLPAPHARIAQGTTRVAFARGQGIEVRVNGDAWRGQPRDLEKVITPVAITVRNHGQEPIQISFQDFSLETPWGTRLSPVPPFQMQAGGPSRTDAVAWGRWYPHDAAFHDPEYVQWTVMLPTEDMLQAALPEGIIDPGGSISGFLYFPDVPRHAAGIFTLRASFPDEETGEPLVNMGIPLVAK